MLYVISQIAPALPFLWVLVAERMQALLQEAALLWYPQTAHVTTSGVEAQWQTGQR